MIYLYILLKSYYNVVRDYFIIDINPIIFLTSAYLKPNSILMKRYSGLLLCALAGLALPPLSYGQFYTIPAEGETWTSTLPSDITTLYEGMNGGTFTFEFADQTIAVGTFTRDYVFDCDVVIKNNTSGASTDSNMWHAQFYADGSSVITFNGSFLLNSKIKTRLDFRSSDMYNFGNAVINQKVTYSGGITLDTCEFWLENINLTYSAEGAQMGYTHFVNGSTVRAKDHDLIISTLAVRGSSLIKEGIRDCGTLIVDNSTVTINQLFVNNGSQDGEFRFSFANVGKAESIVFKGSLYDVSNTAVNVLFEDFGVGDKIYSINDLAAESQKDSIFVNGESFYDMVQSGQIIAGEEILDSTSYNVYQLAIPEPASYAAIFAFGAFALALVRRRLK